MRFLLYNLKAFAYIFIFFMYITAQGHIAYINNSYELLSHTKNSSSKLIILFFYAPWSGISKEMLNYFQVLAKNTDNLLLLAIDASKDTNKNILDQFGIQEIPTSIYIEKGPKSKTYLAGRLKNFLQKINNTRKIRNKSRPKRAKITRYSKKLAKK